MAGHVVVRAKFQPHDTVDLIAACCQENDWHIAHFAQPLEQLKAVDVGKTDVEDHECRQLRSHLRHGIFARRSPCRFEPVGR